MRRWIHGTDGSELEGLGLRRARDGKEEKPTADFVQEAPVFAADVLSLRYSPHDWRTIWGAAALGQTRILARMIYGGQNVDRRDNEGRTALHYATDFRQAASLCVLLEQGADPNAVDLQRKTALFFVREPLAETLLTILVNGGADPNLADINGHTPLFLACAKGNGHLSRLFKNAGAKTGFLEAVIQEKVEIAREMPSQGDLNAHLPDGETLLRRTIKKGSFALTALLLHRGADPNGANSNGQTPLDAAASDSRGRILRLLIDAGATATSTDEPTLDTLRKWAGIRQDRTEEDYSSS